MLSCYNLHNFTFSLSSRGNEEIDISSPLFSSGIVERGKREFAFLAWGDFHARSRFARSIIPKEKWGRTTRSLLAVSTSLYSVRLKNL